MSDDAIVTRVTSASVGMPGRSINTARSNVFVIDSPTVGEALGSGEAFLAGVSSCGVTLIEGQAQRLGMPLERLQVAIEGVRAKDRPMNFSHINMRFEFRGVTPAQAQELLALYQGN
ncbi:MAG: OsmC family protein [Dehalococcoidia bacterium]